MSNQVEVSIFKWTQESEALLRKVKAVLMQVGYEDVHLPTSVFDAEKPITIVFIGQYSAGKSSIIKALTGMEDIEIGEGIRTTETHSYLWNGIEVVDTPGINTVIRPDHDTISYAAISRADMLVYVVTEELFDDSVGKNFRKLLLEKDKAAEMIIVVNKMADVGNTEENRQIKLKDMEKVTTPYTPTNLRTVFVDAKSYLDSLNEEDQDIAFILKERSNYDQLVDTLNRFVADRGISSRLTTVLYKLFDILQDALPNFQSSTGDEDIDAVEEHLLRERHIISQSSWRIETAVKSVYESTASEIRDKGRTIANEIFDCREKAEADLMLEKACADVEELTSICEKKVIEKIEELTSDCQMQLDDFYNSEFSSSLRIKLDKRKDGSNAFLNQIIKSDWLSKVSFRIVSGTTGADAAATGLRAFSGSKVHELVLNVGHYFGHSFKPWEAVKLTKGINVAGKVIGVFGVIFTWGLQAKQDYDEEIRRREIRSDREKIRAGFNEAAESLVVHYTNAINGLLNENYRKQIEDIDQKIQRIRSIRKDKSEAYNLLEETQNECRQLISDIHRETFPLVKTIVE